jgi:hypothetical protein
MPCDFGASEDVALVVVCMGTDAGGGAKGESAVLLDGWAGSVMIADGVESALFMAMGSMVGVGVDPPIEDGSPGWVVCWSGACE